MKCPKYTKEFEKWWQSTIVPNLSFQNFTTEAFKRDTFVGWQAAQERLLKEIDSSVTSYPYGASGEPYILKDPVRERIKNL